MKRHIHQLIIATVAIFLFTACEKEFLDRYPLDQEVSSNFYQTEDDAKQALIAVYDVLGYQSTPGVSWAPFLTMSDILSDDAYAGGADANDGKDENEFNTHNIPATSLIAHSIWLKNYVGIYRANLLLEKIDQIDASDEFKSQVIAECKFMRAYFYFEQVRFFENIPLLTETIKGPSEYSQQQNTPEEVYNQIALDLYEAADDLPEFVPPAEAGRITKWAAQSLLARVYLFYNGVYGANLDAGGTTIDNAQALALLEDVINNSGHDLFEEYEMNFKLAGEHGIESVFEISHGDTPPWWDWDYVRGGEGNLAAQMQGPRVTGSDNWDRGWSFATVSQKLVDDLQDDPRLEYTVLFQEELDGSLDPGYQHTGYFSKKYTSDAEHWGADGQFELNRTCNFRVIRFSDVLLMAAELGSPNAQQYLDRVRARVGLPSVPATPENIYNERRLELSLEGIRYFDVIRKGMAFANQELTVTGLRGPNYIGDQQIFDVNFNTATKGFLPIPQTEIDLSGGLFNQNAGY
jgi:starch-binding outer membrane protein, SusD/RagB family